jgi:cytochrome b
MKDTRVKGPVPSGSVWESIIPLSGIFLFSLLVVAYGTGEEYPHAHAMIGYGIAILVAINLLWLIVKPRGGEALAAPYTPRAIRSHFQNAGSLGKTIALLVALLAALPLCALFIMLLTHTVWGTTRVDEMHEVVAYFALGLVALHVVMVGITSSTHIEGYLRNMFEHHSNKRLN